MHSTSRVRQLPIKIFVIVTGCVSIVVLKIVYMRHIIMNESSAVLFLRLKVKTDVVPVSRPHLIVGVKSVAEVLRHWHW